MPKVLRVGRTNFGTPDYFAGWDETRLQITPSCQPDLSQFPRGALDAIYVTETLEHLPAGQLPKVLEECRRILSPAGFAVFITPAGRFDGVLRDAVTTAGFASGILWELESRPVLWVAAFVRPPTPEQTEAFIQEMGVGYDSDEIETRVRNLTPGST
jgi:SAM-dependent methyltransferase